MVTQTALTLGRLRTIAFLLGQDSSYVTGAILTIGGGLVC